MVRVRTGWFGVRLQYMCLAVAAVSAFHTMACGSRKGTDLGSESLSDGAAGSGAQGGSAGVGGSSGAGGLAEPRCDTRDDGAEVLADDLVGIRNPRLDTTHLYHPFLGGDPDVHVIRIYKLGLEVGAPLEEIFTSEGDVHAFALSEQHVWWAQSPRVFTPPEPDLSEWNVVRVGKAGGTAEVMLRGHVMGFVPSPQGLVIARASEDPELSRGRFQRLPSAGAAPVDLCEYGAIDHYAANGTVVAWIHFRAIETCPLTGGPSTVVLRLEPPDFAEAFAIDSTHAFWGASGAIYRVTLAGGAQETIATNPSPPSYPLLLDGDDVVYREGTRIVRVPKAGGTPRELVPPQNGPIPFFMLNATHVYWGEGSDIICLKRKPK